MRILALSSFLSKKIDNMKISHQKCVCLLIVVAHFNASFGGLNSNRKQRGNITKTHQKETQAIDTILSCEFSRYRGYELRKLLTGEYHT